MHVAKKSNILTFSVELLRKAKNPDTKIGAYAKPRISELQLSAAAFTSMRVFLGIVGSIRYRSSDTSLDIRHM